MSGSKLTDSKATLDFIFAGKAIFTLRSTKSGSHYTYKMRKAEPRTLIDPVTYFLKVLVGSDNTTDYAYAGIVRDGQFRTTGKSKVSANAESVKAFVWALAQFQSGVIPASLEVWHEGRCGRCGRRLTVPSSIATGLGPECAGKVGVPTAELPTEPPVTVNGAALSVSCDGEPMDVVEDRAAQRFPEANNFAKTETPDEFFHRKVNELKAELPGITYGYLGNVYFGPWRDDRSYYIFLPHPNRVGTYDDQVSLGRGCHPQQLKASMDNWQEIEAQVRAKYNNGSVRVEQRGLHFDATSFVPVDATDTMVEYKRTHDPEGFTMNGVLDESEAKAFWTKRYRNQPMTAEEMK
jgi:hypothetical protein